MPNFPLSHIAVNLSLIVAMFVQPVAFCLTGTACGNVGPSVEGRSAQGCVCCDVGNTVNRCCCCKIESQADRSYVNNKDALADLGNAMLPREQRDGNVESPARPWVVAGSSILVVSIDSGAITRPVCQCELVPQPLSESTAHAASDVRHLSLHGVLGDSSGWDLRLPLQANLHSINAALPTHFSQRHLCVWRL
jgi:hypothetical protein